MNKKNAEQNHAANMALLARQQGITQDLAQAAWAAAVGHLTKLHIGGSVFEAAYYRIPRKDW